MISRWIVNQLVLGQIIEEKERKLYEYSFKSLLGNFINIVAAIIIGIVCGEIVRALVFLMVMVPLRSSIGGCHIKNSVICFIVSCGVVVVGVLLPNIVKLYYAKIYIIVLFFCMIIISIISPVDCIEKPLEVDEKKTLAKRVKFINVCIGIFILGAYYFKHYDFCMEITFIVSYALITLVVEIYRKNKE